MRRRQLSILLANPHGFCAGASTPESLVEELIGTLGARYDVTVDQGTTVHEDIHFNLPKTICA
ncbi:MAG: hypothetical protein ABFS30_12495 [Pseudomonadota bacterium]